ncbi:hypothetical protein PV734_44720 [Streptomyces sp. AK08-02]|nr:hypothetical protein [Streptomyces sp. AK08-02]
MRGLVSSFPNDLTLRRRLAEVYRLYGDAAEAGRWMYLEGDRNADETTAFEARYGSPGRRMKALAWHGLETKAANAFAEGQLVAVRTACAGELGHPVDWDDPASCYRDDLASDLDEGQIIEQDVVRVDHSLDPGELVTVGRDVEAQVLAHAVKWHSESRVMVESRTVVFR